MTVPNAFIPFFVLVAVSMSMSLFTCATILKFGSKTISTKLVLYLHVTLLLEELSTIPYLYNGNHGLCEFMGFLHLYSGMTNSVVVLFMTLIYRYIFIEDTYKVSQFITARLEFLIFIPSLVSALPFTTSSYGEVESAWCDIENSTDSSAIWATLLFFGWICTLIVISGIVFCVTVWRVHKTDPEMAKRLLRTIGLYGMVSVVAWLPRVVSREHVMRKEYGNIIVFISGVLYFFIFLQQKSALKLFEVFMAQNEIDLDGTDGGDGFSRARVSSRMFSWEEDDEEVAVRRRTTNSGDGSGTSPKSTARKTRNSSISSNGIAIGNPLL